MGVGELAFIEVINLGPDPLGPNIGLFDTGVSREGVLDALGGGELAVPSGGKDKKVVELRVDGGYVKVVFSGVKLHDLFEG